MPKSKWPEHEKLKSKRVQRDAAQDFYDMLIEDGYVLCKVNSRGATIPVFVRPEALIAKLLDINEQKLEKEKQAMLVELGAGDDDA